MKRKIALLLVISLMLAGCESSDISAVKKSLLGDTSFTTGQAFDNRKVCVSTKWDTTEDRGRTIVEYRCDLAGVEQAMVDYQKSQGLKIHEDAETSKASYQSDIESAKTRLAEGQARLIGEPSDRDTEIWQSQIAEAKRELAWLQTDKISDLVDAPKDVHFERREFEDTLDYYTKAKNAGQDLTVATQALITEKSNEVMAASNFIAEKTASLQSRIQEHLASRANNASMWTKENLEFEANLKIKMDGQAAFNAEVNAQESAALEVLKGQVSVTHVYEIFQWTVPKNGDPVLLYTGNEFIFGNGSLKDMSFSNADAPVKAIIDNKMTSYSEYTSLLGGYRRPA
jgi:major membrane immunogen (membrane-anchored lipoprotein)/predicted RNA binding protein with dsRBD fold (UPF0201 family)